MDPGAPLIGRTAVHRIAVPLPGRYPAVDAYPVDDEPLRLIGAGPATDEALDALRDGIRAAGRRPEDVGLLVLTHQHGDPAG